MQPTNCAPVCADPCDDWCLKPSEKELHQELQCYWEKFLAPKFNQMLQLQYETIMQEIDAKIPDTSVADAFLSDIVIYEDCDKDPVFDCNAVILYEGKLLKSNIKDNDRHPDDTNSWEEIGTLSSILNKVGQFDNSAVLKISYHNSCSDDPNCSSLYSEGECVAIKVDTGEVDSCGEPVFKDEFYVSLEDKNTDVPAEGVESWNGPIQPCDLFKTVCEQLQELPISDDLVGG